MGHMKNYRQLLKELPSNKVVFAFGCFQPPTSAHELQVKVVKKLAEEQNSDYIIYASQNLKEDLLPAEKKVQYMNLMFPNTNIKTTDVATFVEAAKELNKKYKNIVMVTSSDCKEDYTKILNKRNGSDFFFETIEVVSAGDVNPDDNKLKESAKKGDYVKFKTSMPSSLREIDSRRLMNDMRQSLGLDMVKEKIKLVKDELRESYFRGEIFNVGEIVESDGQQYEIVKRGSNHLLLKEESGKLVSKWIQDVTVVKETTDSPVVNKNSKFNIAKDIMRYKDFKKLNAMAKGQVKEQEESDEPSEMEEFLKTLTKTAETGHTMGSRDDNHRRRKIAYHIGEQFSEDEVQIIDELSTELLGRYKTASAADAKKSDSEGNYAKGDKRFKGINKATNKQFDNDLKKHGQYQKEETELEEGTFKYHMDKAIAAHERGDAKKKQYHLGNAKTARYAIPSADYPKHKELFDKYKQMNESSDAYEQSEDHKVKAEMAKGDGNMGAYHAHMVNHHELKGHWHASKGRHEAADKEYEKAERHHNDSLKHPFQEEVELSEAAPFKTKEDAVKYAKEKVKTHRDNLDGIEIYAHSGGFDVNHTSNSSGRNSLQKIGSKHVGTIYKEEVDLEEAKKKQKKQADEFKPTAVEVKIKDDSQQLGANNSHGFDAFFNEEEEKEYSEEEIDKMIGDMSEDDIMDAYDDEELAVIDDETGEEIEEKDEDVNESVLMEVLSRIERMRARVRFAKTKSKRERQVKLALRRTSSNATINKRARRLAIKLMKQRMLRGRPASALSIGEKERIETMIQKRKSVVNRIAMKLTSRVRQVEKARLNHSKFTQGKPAVGQI